MGGHRLSRQAAVGLVLGAVALAAVSTLGIAVLGGGLGNGNPTAYRSVTCADPSLAGSVVDVSLYDHGVGMMAGGGPMMASLQPDRGSVPSGTVSFLAHNRGFLNHELVVLPLPADGPGTRSIRSDGTVDDSQSLGEASRSCAPGAGNGIAPGSTGWVTIKLRPGHYELICNEPWHYAAGMFNVLTVT